MAHNRRRRRRLQRSLLAQPAPGPAPPAALEDENLLGEILLRLPPQPSSLPRAAAVCRLWNRLVSDAGFFSRFRAHHRKPPLLGVFIDTLMYPEFYPISGPPDAIPPERFSLATCLGDEEDGVWQWELHGCRDGLVLFYNNRNAFMVWDPASGDCSYVAIPADFSAKVATICSGAVLGSAGGDGSSSHFQVVLIGSSNDQTRGYASYSSVTGMWGDLICMTVDEMYVSSTSILVADSLYWLMDDDMDSGIIKLDLATQSLAVIDMPPDIHNLYDFMCTCRLIVAEGGGVGLVVLTHFSLDMWGREVSSDGIARWNLWKSVSLEEITGGLSKKARGDVIINGYDEDGNMIFLRTNIGCFMVQLESMQFKNLGKSGFMALAFHPYRSFCTSQGLVLDNETPDNDDSKDGNSNADPDRAVFNNWSFDPKVSRQELMRMFALHKIPFNLVESDAFKRFVASLNPSFRMVCQSNIRDDCIGIFEEQKLILREALRSADCRISLATDTWTLNETLGYMSVTCHFINADWKVEKRIIQFFPVEIPHNGAEIFIAVLKCIEDWNIEGNLYGITLVNSAANDTMADILKRNLVHKKILPVEGKLLHNHCATHIINLIVNDGLKFLDSVVDKIRESAKYIQSSYTHKQKFEEFIVQIGISGDQRPSLDIPTCWNSTYLMLETALKFRRAYDILALQDADYTYAPSCEDWERVEIVCGLLKVCYEATMVFSCSSCPTSNLYFHEIWKIKLTLDGVASETDNGIQVMVKRMKKEFKKYWLKSYISLSIPVVLDPRFKYMFVEFRLKQSFGADVNKRLERVHQVLSGLFDEYSSQFNNSNDFSTQDGGAHQLAVVDNGPFADWYQHLGRNLKSQGSTELDRYLSEEPVHLPEDFDILKWWMVYSSMYPTLARVARDVLAVPASTVSSKSAFNTGERVISDSYSRLPKETVEALIGVQDWYCASGSHRTMSSITDLSDLDDLPM